MKIKNFALIKELQLQFAHGMNVLTGETGAGKSIIIDSLSAILGEKMTTSFIRTGSNKAVVQGTFILESNTQAEKLLDSMGIEVEGRYVQIRRELGNDGRGRSFINGVHLPTSKLKEVGNLLVDIHGQNEHQAILKVKNQLHILDLYGQREGLLTKREEVSHLYHSMEELRQALEDLESASHDKEMRIELLQHAVGELDQANLRPGEEEELQAEAKRLSGGEKLYSELQHCYEIFQGSSEQLGLFSLLGSAEKYLGSAAETDERLHAELSQMQEIQYQLEDIGQTIRDNMEKIDFSPSRLEEVEARLDLISRLCKKYKVKDSAALLEYKANAERELENINLSEEQIQKAKDDLAQKQREYTEKAADLSNMRLEVSRGLEQQMDEELVDLAMERTRFRIKIQREEQEDSPVRIGEQGYKAFASGIDLVEFFIAAGEKESLRPLKKIASGGEMSRLMLSLKKIIIDKVEPQSMVFDEVDSGIGGKVAERVGQKLRGLSNKAQVICITHLPQIAAMADIQFSVAKEEDEEGRVITQLKRLTAKERQEEIARMLGGEKITELTREHAKELIDMAQQMKNE